MKYLLTTLALAAVLTSHLTAQEKRFPWRSSAFISAGYSYPIGLRTEVGYIFGHAVSIGVNVSAFNSFSIQPQHALFGLSGRFFIPVSDWTVMPYIQVGFGVEPFQLFDEDPDSYALATLGCMWPVHRWLTLRPELGYTFTSAVTKQGGGLLSGVPTEYDNRHQIHVGLMLELDL